jgi:hypothetical protein
MFNKIKEIFIKKKKKTTDTLCSIMMSVKKDGSIETSLYWPEWTDNFNEKDIEVIATEYSVLLHLLSNGSFKNDILTTLDKAKKINTSTKDQIFLQYINSHMQSLNKFYGNSFTSIIKKDSPVISPTSVFKSPKV